MVDRAGDLMGLMRLEIPGRAVPEGRPLILEVEGDNSGSADWYMTFCYRFQSLPSVRVEPLELRSRQNRVLRLSIDNLNPAATVEVSGLDSPSLKQPLNIGGNIIRVPFSFSSAGILTVKTIMNRVIRDITDVGVEQTTQRDIYLLPYSHNDIGYTDLQPVVERRHWMNLEQSLRLAEQTKSYPPDARFKWNVEVLWALDSFLRQATAAQKADVYRAIREGSLGVNAWYGNVQTGIMNADELDRALEFARTLSQESGVPITTALISDVPGFTWGTVSALVQSGIRYFASSPNPFDRIGFVLQKWGDRPFYWQSQSGKQEILTWVAGLSYASFHEGSLSKLGEDKIVDILARLESGGYPYRIVNLPYTLGDNAGIDTTLSDFVNRWNDTYRSPRLVIATYDRLFNDFEKEYGKNLPHVGGDFTPYWEDGTISTAAETAMNRHSADRLAQAEVIWSIVSPSMFPSGKFLDAWRNVLLYDEHTWGAWNSVSEPDDPNVKEQWDIKRRFAVKADSLSRVQLAQVPRNNNAPSLSTWSVFNTVSWPRDEVVYVSQDVSSGKDEARDENGKVIPSQRMSTGELAVAVGRIPSLGVKNFSLHSGEQHPAGKARVDGLTLSNDKVVVEVDSVTGFIKRFYSRVLRRELTDTSKKFNRLLYVRGTDSTVVFPMQVTKIHSGESGGLVASLVIVGKVPSCEEYECELRLAGDSDRLEIIHRLNKIPVREKESIHIAFPFSLDLREIRYDVPAAIVRPEKDQLPGSCKNFFSVQSFVDVSNKTYGITIATPDAPLVEFGALTAMQPWRETVALGNEVFSYVMNNYWHTNFKADQGGKVEFRFLFSPHGPFDGKTAWSAGREARRPQAVLRGRIPPGKDVSLRQLTMGSSVIESLRPLPDGAVLAVFYNPGAVADTIQWTSAAESGLFHCNQYGEKKDPLRNPLVLSPFETIVLRVENREN
jgi:hypothetical protein